MNLKLVHFRSIATASIVAMAFVANQCSAVELVVRDFQPKPLERIPAGTVIDKEHTPGWSDLMMFVNGSLGRGDIEAASGTVKYYAALFNLVYMANVKKDESNRFYLDKVGVGFSTNIKGRDVVISSNTHKQLGANLGFIGGSVFSANEKALDDIVQIARYRDGAIFDAPTIMLLDGRHKKVVVRFFVWVSPQGKLGTVLWALDGFGSSNYMPIDNEVVLLQPRLIENRVMNVDGDRFTFGIPAEDAFAMVSLPPGRTYPINRDLGQLISQRTYNAQSFFDAISRLAKSLSTDP